DDVVFAAVRVVGSERSEQPPNRGFIGPFEHVFEGRAHTDYAQHREIFAVFWVYSFGLGEHLLVQTPILAHAREERELVGGFAGVQERGVFARVPYQRPLGDREQRLALRFTLVAELAQLLVALCARVRTVVVPK